MGGMNKNQVSANAASISMYFIFGYITDCVSKIKSEMAPHLCFNFKLFDWKNDSMNKC